MFNNHILHLVYKYPDGVDWKALSENPNLTSEFIEKNLDKLNLIEISCHPNMTLEMIKKHIGKIDWGSVWLNPNLNFSDTETLNFVYQYWDIIAWNPLSSHPNLTDEFIGKHSENINWNVISTHHKCSYEFVKKYLHLMNMELFFFNNPYITNKIIENPEFILITETNDPNRIWTLLGGNPSLSSEVIDKYGDKLYWPYISSNENLTLPLIKKYMDKFEMFHEKVIKSSNPEGTAEIDEELKKLGAFRFQNNWRRLSFNPNLTDEMIEENIDKFDMSFLSENINLSLRLVEKYYDKLSLEGLVRYNRNLDFAFLEKSLNCPVFISDIWKNPLNLEPFILAQNKKKYSQLLASEITQEIFYRKIRHHKKIYDLCIHEIKLNIRDTKLGINIK